MRRCIVVAHAPAPAVDADAAALTPIARFCGWFSSHAAALRTANMEGAR